MRSILRCTSGKLRICELMRLRFGYTPSLMPSKNEVTLRRVSSMVLSFLMDRRSIAAELLSSGFRKSMQSMNPPDGKLSSNIIMRRISSVRSSLLRMCAGLVEKVSVAVLSAAYAVEHLSEMILLMRSNPIFCSSLVSIVLFFSSKSFSPLFRHCPSRAH